MRAHTPVSSARQLLVSVVLCVVLPVCAVCLLHVWIELLTAAGAARLPVAPSARRRRHVKVGGPDPSQFRTPTPTPAAHPPPSVPLLFPTARDPSTPLTTIRAAGESRPQSIAGVCSKRRRGSRRPLVDLGPTRVRVDASPCVCDSAPLCDPPGAIAHAVRAGDAPTVTALGSSSLNQGLKGALWWGTRLWRRCIFRVRGRVLFGVFI